MYKIKNIIVYITKNYFNKEYKDYADVLQKTYESYSDHFKKDKDGQVVVNKSGIPELDDKDVANKMYEEINDLLSLEVEVGRFYIDESTFDYDDSKYDVLTPKDMFALMDFLCRKDEDKAE